EKLARLEESEQKRLLRGASADDPRRDPVDARIEEIQPDPHAIKGVAPNDFLHDRTCRIVQEHHMVAVPPDAAADVEQKSGQKREHRGNFVGDSLRRVKVTGVEAKKHLVLHRVAEIELMRSDDTRLGSDAKELALDGIEVARRTQLLLKNGVEARCQAHSGSLAVGGQILVAVRNPNIRDSWRTKLFADFGGDRPGAFAVFDPEIADTVIRMRQSESVGRLFMSKAGRVEIHAEPVGFAPVDPALEMLDLNGVAIGAASAEISVYGVKIDAMPARNQPHRLLDVGSQLLDRPRLSGIISRQGQAAAQNAACALESPDIISLPAMNGED